MLTFTPIRTTHEAYPFVEQLLHESFPMEERRADSQQREYTDNNPLFQCLLITDGPIRVGIITLWTFPEFTYAEHLATSPEVRNKGYGKQIMEQIKEYISRPLILEVELPQHDLAVRRIRFYERCGFTLQPYEYLQPPYHEGFGMLPLRIMTALTETFSEEQFLTCRNQIYKHVYNFEPGTAH